MDIDALRSDYVEYLRHLLRRPQMWGGWPECAEGMIVEALTFAVILDRQCSFSEAQNSVRREFDDIVAEIPRGSNQAVLLCHETRIPPERTSFNALIPRAHELCRRLLGHEVLSAPGN